MLRVLCLWSLLYTHFTQYGKMSLIFTGFLSPHINGLYLMFSAELKFMLNLNLNTTLRYSQYSHLFCT